jgi:hypothetical protein
LNKKAILLTILVILFLSPLAQTEEFETPEAFTEYIYENYAEENFSEVYNNFAAELKRKLEKQVYLDFQEQNFKKYNLEYTEIEVGQAKEIEFDEIKDKFNYAMDFGHYYNLKVSYLLKFNRFGRRDERSEKLVYLRKINADFQIFWDYQNALNDDKAVNRDDDNE